MSTNVATDVGAEVVDKLRSVLGPGRISLHEPRFAGNEWTYVKACLDSTFVSSVGSFVPRFESELAAYTGARHAVAVVNGTAALQVALRLGGVQANDEVLVPALTFVGTAAAVVHCGAVPHFIDSDERTLGVDPQALREYLKRVSDIRSGQCVNRETGRAIRAVVPMHTFGHPMDIDALLELARDFHLVVIEDAAESLGSTVRGRHTGTFGLMGVLSFNGNKTVTTGGGGAILTDDAGIAAHAKHLVATAKVPHRWEFRHDEIGYNYRMPNINAALGCAQLEQLPDFVLAKRRVFDMYAAVFANLPYGTIVREPKGTCSNYWLNALLLKDAYANMRDPILTATNDAGLLTRPAWMPLHQLTPYAAFPRMSLTGAESLAARLINLPSSAVLGMEQRG